MYTISGVASGCERKGSASADESPTRVFLLVHKSVILDKSRPCTEEAGFVDASVVLHAPLQNRALVGCRVVAQASENAYCRDLSRARGFAPPGG